MIFAIGFLTGLILTLSMVFGVFFLYFRNQQPIERQINQWISQAKPKGAFIQAPTDSEIARKDKLERLSKIKNEIRLGDILEKDTI
jgi:hypothetical protein